MWLQRREMAVLRILGSQRGNLFAIVIVEVIVIGIIGVSLGVVLGQLITQYLVLPLIEYLISQQGVKATIQPVVSFSTILPPVISAFAILIISAIKPAQDASKTKVMHAINPGAADNIQLEDLDKLREKRPSLKLFMLGAFMMFTVTLVIGLDVISQLGNPALEATIFFAMLIFMVVGLGLVFFILARPLEKLILGIVGLIAPRLTFFAKRNVSRSTTRNTLISLLVLFSGILPSFLATQSAISNANIETTIGEFLAEWHQARSFQHGRGDGHDLRILLRKLDHGLSEYRCVRRRRWRSGIENAGLRIVGGGAVVLNRSGFGDRPAFPFLRDDMKNGRR
jgi:putative ABC transport system permease protein